MRSTGWGGRSEHRREAGKDANYRWGWGSEDRRAGSEGTVEVLSEEGFAALRSEQGKT
jgi:hypothetical protein